MNTRKTIAANASKKSVEIKGVWYGYNPMGVAIAERFDSFYGCWVRVEGPTTDKMWDSKRNCWKSDR